MKKMIATVTIAMLLMLPLLLVIPLPAIAEPTEALSDAVGAGTGGTYYLDPTILYIGGVTITGDTTIYGRGAVIDLDGEAIEIIGAYLYIERCTITNGIDGLYFDDDATGFVYNNIIVQNDGDGIDIEDCDEGEIVIKENSILQNGFGEGDDGIEFDESTNIIILENMITHNSDDGIDGDNYDLMWDDSNDGHYLPEVNDLHNIVIKGNKIIGNGDDEGNGDGIELEFVNGVSIASNLIAGNEEDGIDFDESCPVASVINNKILANDDDAIEYGGDQYNWPEYRDHTVELSLTISYNKIMGNNDEAIRIENMNNIVITYNEIMWNEKQGIFIDGATEPVFIVKNILIAYNTIRDNEEAEMTSNGVDLKRVSDVKILFNKIIGTHAGDGIEIWDSAIPSEEIGEDLLIKGNVIEGNEGHGIDIDYFNSPVIIEWNTILGNGDDGISLGHVESPQILYNTIMYSWNDEDGIGIDYCDGAWIAYNTIAYNTGNSINVDVCNDVIIEYNTMIGAEEDGIYANHCEDMTIQYNKIYDNEKDGIEWYQCSGLIANNIIGYSGSLSGNQYGIYLEICMTTTISDNTIIGNDHGIHCAGSDPTIIGNYIAKNIYGIWLGSGDGPGSNPTIGGSSDNRNYIIRNYEDGVYIADDQSNPTINYNNIYENVGYGVNNFAASNDVDAEDNYWGDISGPGNPATFGVGPGAGDEITKSIMYSPWLASIMP